MSDDYIAVGIADKTIKMCPYCGVYSELISGCNFVTCACSPQSCWCFKCGKRKGAGENLCPYGNLTSCNSH